MESQLWGNHSPRRYVRVAGPFEGCHLGARETPVLIYDLNVGGGFINFVDEQPDESMLALEITLPNEGSIKVNAETVYRHPSGIAVRFVDVDTDTSARLNRSIAALEGAA